MGRRLNDLADLIYADLRGNLMDHPLTMLEVMRRYQVGGGSTTRRALVRVRELARKDGLTLTIPGPTNGYQVVLTRDASRILDGALWLTRVAQGVIHTAAGQAQGLRQGLADLPPGPDRDDAEEVADAAELLEVAARAGARRAQRIVDQRRRRRASR